MIKGFEKQTHDLTPEEKKLLPAFVSGLRVKIGKKKAITNKTIRKKFKDDPTWAIDIPDARVRKIINYIRVRGLVPLLCASSKGYYVAHTKEEIEDYLQGLKERIESQQAVFDVLEKQYKQL